MNRITFVCIFFLLSIFNIQAQYNNQDCDYGFYFIMSNNPNWGYGELIISYIDPNSPAQTSGLKVGDIIMEIDGKATYLRTNETISDWMFNRSDPTVKFTVRNPNTYFHEYTFKRKCISKNAISEKQLSELFSLYSIENANQERFTLPITISRDSIVNYVEYQTYNFAKYDKNNAIDVFIVNNLKKELSAKGLVMDTVNPSMIVQAYYNISKNPNFSGLIDNPSYSAKSQRYDTHQQQMVSLPIFDVKEKNLDNRGQYVISYGIRFYDSKKIDAENNYHQIWHCNIKDYLSKELSFDKYIKLHTPLLLMEYPYTEVKNNADYVVNFNRYNYTGLYLDRDNLKVIKDVDDGSPAYNAGIRKGYIIKKINNIEMNESKEEILGKYDSFINNSMGYRNSPLLFGNNSSSQKYMTWDMVYYSEIEKQLKNQNYINPFTYLYNFEEYIDNKTSKEIIIDAWDGLQTRKFTITPDIKESVVITAMH